jgi:hypothetical protein
MRMRDVLFDNDKNSNSKSLHYFSSSSFTQSHDISLSLSHQKENTVPLGARWNEYDMPQITCERTAITQRSPLDTWFSIFYSDDYFYLSVASITYLGVFCEDQSRPPLTSSLTLNKGTITFNI